MEQERAMSGLNLRDASGFLARMHRWVFGASAKDEGTGVLRCGACDQKMRYSLGKAGGVGQCPRCLHPTRLPRTPLPLAAPRLSYRTGQRLLREIG
jgi:hypothetical protein